MSPEARRNYQALIADLQAENMIFLDKSLFNKTTGWRLTVWVPIKDPARYTGDRHKGHSWSLLAGYTTQGYLSCWTVKEGYFNLETFYQWLVEQFLPFCKPGTVIIMDNVNVHCNPIIKEAIIKQGCLVRYLSPYSPEFNPIELSFSVFKAWVRRCFHELWPYFNGLFGEFLEIAVRESCYDCFAEAHFCHNSNEIYVFEGDMERLDARLRAFENGRSNDLDT